MNAEETLGDVTKLEGVAHPHDDEAKVAANFVANFAFQHRFGVLKKSDHQVIAYCNMGGSGRECKLLTRLLEVAADIGWKVRGVSWCDERYSWAVVFYGWDSDGERIEESDVGDVYRPLIDAVWSEVYIASRALKGGGA